MLDVFMIAENVEHIRQRIAAACRRSGRNQEDVGLIAVTKSFDTASISEAVGAGVADIGENYVQELCRKHDKLGHTAIRWHFIGHLQSNKLKYIAGWIHLIQTVDSMSLGRRISAWGERSGTPIEVLVEVNTSGEKTKFGVPPADAPALVRDLLTLPSIKVTGLMTIGPLLPARPPAGWPAPESSRSAFRRLREIQTSLRHEGIELPHLSMGMTNDFEVAIEEGATMVRIGTAIFGTREQPHVQRQEGA